MTSSYGTRADVDTAMDAVARLVPVDLPRRHREAGELGPVAGFDREDVAGEHDRDTVERVAMPVHRLARPEPQPADEHRSTPEELLLGHRTESGTPAARPQGAGDCKLRPGSGRPRRRRRRSPCAVRRGRCASGSSVGSTRRIPSRPCSPCLPCRDGAPLRCDRRRDRPSGGAGRRVVCVAVARRDRRAVPRGRPPRADTLYAGLREHGVRRSDDGGGTWVDCELPEPGVFSLAVSAATARSTRAPSRVVCSRAATGAARGRRWTRSSSCRHVRRGASRRGPGRRTSGGSRRARTTRACCSSGSSSVG